MRIDETFTVAAPPEAVFDYMTDPANLAAWQTSKTHVEPLSDGAPRLGYRIRERTKPPRGKEFEQVVEFVEFERPIRFAVHIVEGPYPVDGAWTLVREGDRNPGELHRRGRAPGSDAAPLAGARAHDGAASSRSTTATSRATSKQR